MARELTDLLFRIRDGAASSDEVERARVLVSHEQGLPDELRQVIDFRDDPAGDAAGLLAVLGADSLFGDVLREGMAAELDEGEPAAQPEATNREEIVLDEVWPLSEVFVAALRHEAGEVELSHALVETLGLQAAPMPLAEAVAAEAGQVELTEAVFAAVGLPYEGLEVADAVRDEAGEASLQPDAIEAFAAQGWISAMVDGELDAEARVDAIRNLRSHPEAGATMTAFASLGTELRQAVRDEAGEVGYLWADVAQAIGIDAEAVTGWDGAAFAEALREEAGSVDVAEAVMARVVRPLPSPVVEPDPIPEAANGNRSWSGLLMALAAAAVLLIAVPTTWNRTGGPSIEVSNAQFAAADEIVIENLDYGENSNVQQMMGDEGALILWVDEGSVQ